MSRPGFQGIEVRAEHVFGGTLFLRLRRILSFLGKNVPIKRPSFGRRATPLAEAINLENLHPRAQRDRQHIAWSNRLCTTADLNAIDPHMACLTELLRQTPAFDNTREK